MIVPCHAPVSIPSRGSGKGDNFDSYKFVGDDTVILFQSPLGEVVKETLPTEDDWGQHPGFNPLSGKW